MKTVLIPTDHGPLPMCVPNETVDGDGFYISYNDHDVSTYGSDTTALVIGQMQAFYVLDGDHRAAYQPLIAAGLGSCLDYFIAHLHEANKFSDKDALARRESGGVRRARRQAASDLEDPERVRLLKLRAEH